MEVLKDELKEDKVKEVQEILKEAECFKFKHYTPIVVAASLNFLIKKRNNNLKKVIFSICDNCEIKSAGKCPGKKKDQKNL